MDPPPAVNVNLGHIARDTARQGEYVWRDNAGDERTDFASPDPRVDLLAFRVTADASNLYFAAVMSDINQATGEGAPQIQVALDMDRLVNSGEPTLGGNADTEVDPDAEWEYLLMTRFGSANNDMIVWQNGYGTQIFTGTAAISLTTDVIEASVPWRALDMGATDLLNKPVSMEDLIARIWSALRLKGYQDELKNQKNLLEQKVDERTAELEESRLEIIWRLAKAGEIIVFPSITSANNERNWGAGRFLSKYPEAPFWRACSKISSSAAMVSITILMSGKRCLMFRVASRPSRSGMWISIRINSGCSSAARASASTPFWAVPMI